MATGYLSRSATDTQGMSYEAMLYCKTNIAGYFFDGFINVNVSHNLTITSNPVESGASVVDHAYVEPTKIVMDVLMSDVHQSLVPGQFEGGWSRSRTAYDLLKQLQQSRVPFSVLCWYGLFENMLISSIEASEDADTIHGLRATVTLTEIPIARVKTVEISRASQTTISTEMGKIQAVDTTPEVNQTLLRQLAGKVLIESGG